MSETTDKFINTFEKLKAEVNRRARRQNSERFELEEAARNDGAINKHFLKLKYIRDVRNALQHPQHDTPQRAFDVSPGFLGEVEQLLKYLVSPPTAKDIWVPRPALTIADPTDRIGDLAAVMKTKGFSHLPILDQKGAVIGVFNEAAVFAHLWKEDVTLIGRDMTVADIMESCRLDARHTETFEFVGPTKTQEQLVNLFVTIPSPTTRVGAVFVTASGSPRDPLQGLITPWDVLARISS